MVSDTYAVPHQEVKRVLMAALVSLSCAGNTTYTYEDVCRTARVLCATADVLCYFAPKMKATRADSTGRAQALKQVDSLATALQQQVNSLGGNK